MNNIPKLPKVTVDDLIKAQQARDVGIAVVALRSVLVSRKLKEQIEFPVTEPVRIESLINVSAKPEPVCANTLLIV